MNAKIVGDKLSVNGYLYTHGKAKDGKIYWECVRYRMKECRGRAITAENVAGGVITVYKGPDKSQHAHPPNFNEVSAETVKEDVKRKAADHPEMPPAQILRTDLADLSEGILLDYMTFLYIRE